MLLIKKFGFILSLIFGLTTIAFSQHPGFGPLTDSVSFKNNLSKTAKETKTIQSDFVQEKNLSVLAEKIITKGSFMFKKDNMLRWQYTDPFQYLIIMNKNKVYIKDDSRENKYDMQSNKMFQEINNMIVNSVQGNVLNSKDYKIKYYQNEKYYLVDLTPLNKNMKGFLKSISLYFDKKDFTVSKLTMTEPSGDYTNIAFTNKKVNAEIPDEKFHIK
ncbi:MAG: outer membrane lipoprotein carrier protein LolA [Sporocytophaga sp.]|uniref:LolA family protein n=1 Tax=Sporocytophaga sp. TaxID=2231183 RepID=UPI001B00E5DF|nr:outer membrane lipoprotein carrier protein LolA [Sporocytophaga sp.]MBO9700292.1 outer membrane lipoprotein carrier protein LolA [Sporocytophaga sp.]